jgi:YfiH family protein
MWTIEQLPLLGRIAVPPSLPQGLGVFCTTRDFYGRLDDSIARQITDAVRDRFGVEAVLNTCTQVHGATVAHAPVSRQWRECDSCDALWTAEAGVALGIKIADCLPITLADPVHGVLANVHSGWRGAAQEIVRATLDTLRTTAFDPGSSFAYLGPSIRVCCFEVGEEVADRFEARYADRSHAKPHLDLVAFTKDVLLRAGLPESNISDSGLCTRCDGSIFHSYRRDGAGGGRNLMIAAR